MLLASMVVRLMVGLCGETLAQFLQLLVGHLQEDATGLDPRCQDGALAREVEEVKLPQYRSHVRSDLEPLVSAPGCRRTMRRLFPEIEIRRFPSADHSHIATSRVLHSMVGGTSVRKTAIVPVQGLRFGRRRQNSALTRATPGAEAVAALTMAPR